MPYRNFIEMKDFTRTWAALGMNDDDLRALQSRLIQNPEAGPVMQQTGGARKIRIAFAGQGKSGSGRAIYVDIEVRGTIYLLMAYPKNKQENLTPGQRQYIGGLIDNLKGE